MLVHQNYVQTVHLVQIVEEVIGKAHALHKVLI
jgi:hypothetical protein